MTDTTGTEPPEHRACREAAPTFTAADLDAARAQGRREADNALDWQTSCIGCADALDRLYAERMAGYAEAAQIIASEIRARYAETGERALSEAVAIALRHAAGPPGSTHSPEPGSGAAADGNASQAVSAGQPGLPPPAWPGQGPVPPFDGAAG